MEERGLSTVTLSLFPDVTRRVRPPRALAVSFGSGHPFGGPGRPHIHQETLAQALRLVETADSPGVLVEGPRDASYDSP